MRSIRACCVPCAIVILGIAPLLFSQPTVPSLNSADFPSEPYIVKTASSVVSMNADGSGSRLFTFAAVLQSEAALRNASVVSIDYPAHSEHADFTYVRVVHSDGTVEQTPVSSAIEQPAPVTQQAPLYSDIQSKQIPVRSLRVGDTLEWQARFAVDHPEIPNQSWGQDAFINGVVVLDETYELRVPIGLHVTAWTNPTAHAEFSESTAGGTHIYRWHHSALRPTVGPQADAFRKSEETRLRTPEEELDDTKGAMPSFAWTTFPDWASVGAWYRSLFADRAIPDDAIKAKVAELTAGKTSDLEKAQAVYTYVATQIRYVGVDFGIGRYQPHLASEVFGNRFGDCKDKQTLLAAMLSVLNLHADPVLIGAGIRFNPSVPYPPAFNHAIARLTLNGKDIWLDPTAEIGIWGSLLKPIRDQDALVIPPGAPAVIAHTPADLPYPQVNTFSVVGSLDNDLTSDSKIQFTLRDDTEMYLRAALHGVSPANYADFVQGWMANMGFGGTTSDPAIDHLDDPAQPLVISFHYHRVKEKDWGENNVTATFQNIGLPSFASDKPPVEAIALGSPRTEDSIVKLQLPAGWSASLPEAVHAHTAFATCDVTYSIKDHVISAERRLTVLQPTVPVKDAKQYQTWYDDAGAGSYPYLAVLPPPKAVSISTVTTPSAPGVVTVGPSDPHAAELIQKAMQSARAMDLDPARTLLDEAAKINPTEKNLWLGYATVAGLLGAQHEAMDDAQRELSYHPDEVTLYSKVASAQFATHDSEGGLKTLRAWVKAEPDKPDAALALSRQLQAMQRLTDALETAQDAIAHLEPMHTDITGLRIVAASAQAGLGHADQAAASVFPLLESATGPAQINDIAYVLAEANTHLSEAVAAESKILITSEAETAAWKTSDNPLQASIKQSNLAAEWDTMAWLLYRQGKLQEAFAYANAACRAKGGKDQHDHLTAIATALHSPAASAIARDDDQKLRTYPLGPATGRKGVAQFILLLADGKVVDSVSLADHSNSNQILPDSDSLLKSADLHALFPPGSTAHLLRNGFVNCHQTVCELFLSPLMSTQ